MGCKECEELNIIKPIKIPKDLLNVITVVKKYVEDGTLSVFDEDSGGWIGEFRQMAVEGAWDDFVHFEFACNSCNQQFELTAETYHGSGGRWKPK